MGKLSRTKGAAFERKTVTWLKALGLRAKRCFQYRGEEDGPDVLVELPSGMMLAVECKHHKRVSWRKAWEQSLGQRGPIVHNAVRAKDDRSDPVWIVSDELMAELLRDFFAGMGDMS